MESERENGEEAGWERKNCLSTKTQSVVGNYREVILEKQRRIKKKSQVFIDRRIPYSENVNKSQLLK